jgi:hypothetical protein
MGGAAPAGALGAAADAIDEGTIWIQTVHTTAAWQVAVPSWCATRCVLNTLPHHHFLTPSYWTSRTCPHTQTTPVLGHQRPQLSARPTSFTCPNQAPAVLCDGSEQHLLAPAQHTQRLDQQKTITGTAHTLAHSLINHTSTASTCTIPSTPVQRFSTATVQHLDSSSRHTPPTLLSTWPTMRDHNAILTVLKSTSPAPCCPACCALNSHIPCPHMQRAWSQKEHTPRSCHLHHISQHLSQLSAPTLRPPTLQAFCSSAAHTTTDPSAPPSAAQMLPQHLHPTHQHPRTHQALTQLLRPSH